MGCIYTDRDGKCTLWDEENNKGENFENSEMGFDNDGFCGVEDDPCPDMNCANFESDDPNAEYDCEE